MSVGKTGEGSMTDESVRDNSSTRDCSISSKDVDDKTLNAENEFESETDRKRRIRNARRREQRAAKRKQIKLEKQLLAQKMREEAMSTMPTTTKKTIATTMTTVKTTTTTTTESNGAEINGGVANNAAGAMRAMSYMGAAILPRDKIEGATDMSNCNNNSSSSCSNNDSDSSDGKNGNEMCGKEVGAGSKSASFNISDFDSSTVNSPFKR